jgi:hypothetical protein
MEKLEKKIEKIKVASSINKITYQVQISKIACESIKKKFPEFDNLSLLKSNKQIIKNIMKIIDIIMKDKKLFIDRKAIKELDKSEICIGVCKIMLNLNESEAQAVLSDIKFIIEEFYKQQSFFLKSYKKLKNLFVN